jgi:heptosyltransferase-2
MPSLVVQTSFLGDTVLTTPLLEYLAARDVVDAVTTVASAALLARNPAVREVIVYDKRAADRGVRGFVRMARALRARRYDVAYLAQGSVRSGALTLAAGIRRRVGLATSAGRRFYTERVVAPDNDHHAARLLRLAMTRDTDGREPTAAMLRPRLYPGASEREAVDKLFAATESPSSPLVVLAPGSVWATKRWPYYPELASYLAPSARIALVGGVEDRPLADEIAAATGAQVVDATGRLSLLGSAELIGRGDVLVTNDSAPLHLASAMGTPTVAIFGPTVPEFGFGPLAPRSRVAGHPELACRPCDRHGPQRCPLGHWRCMREISAEDVATLVQEIVASDLASPPAPPPPPLPEPRASAPSPLRPSTN